MLYCNATVGSQIAEAINQRKLDTIVRSIFPDRHILYNARKEALIRNPNSENFLELDIWIPDLNIAFEFQDPYHYTTSWDSQIPLQGIQKKDNKEIASSHGLTLVVVPCWWDGEKESLQATINFVRPDLYFAPSGQSTKNYPQINLNPLPSHFQLAIVPNVGELMLASFPPSPNFKNLISEDNAWWMGEKYDGIRVCWNSLRDEFRGGNKIDLPDSFYSHFFFDLFLDGEIWFGRGQFTQSQKILSGSSVDWPSMRMIAFDKASPSTRGLPFETRYSHLLLRSNKTTNNTTNKTNDIHPFIIIAHRVLCCSMRDVKVMMKGVLHEGGEGLIFRQPASLYSSGRSPFLFKLKAARGDKEAIVEFVGADGAVLLKLPDGNTFQVSPPEEETEDIVIPKKGDIVTFSYSSFSKNSTPVKPRIERVRTDVSWHNIVRDFWENDYRGKETSTTVKEEETGLLATKRGKKLRKYFEDFACKKGFDPLIASQWYKITRTSVEELKGSTLMNNFKGGFVKLLSLLFPNIGLDVRRFKKHPTDFWKDPQNRRNFFEHIAKQKNFDPLVAEKWKLVTKEDILAMKGGETLLQFYSKNISKALSHVFPEIQFPQTSSESIHTDESRRKVFEKYAKEKGFDPLVASNWYNITGDNIASESKEAQNVMNFYGSYIKTVIQLFREVKFDESRFAMLPKNYWGSENNRKQFFINFAVDNNFDPYDIDKWYKVEKSNLLHTKGAVTMLKYYSGCHITALLSLFPHLSFDSSRFLNSQSKYWDSVANRRKVFVDYANTHGFDLKISENWYLAKDKLAQSNDVKQVVSFYKGSVSKALQQLFPNLNIDSTKFTDAQKWQDAEKRKQWFINFATERGFDPLVRKNWDTISVSHITSVKGSHAVLRHYGGNLKKAVKELFPTT